MSSRETEAALELHKPYFLQAMQTVQPSVSSGQVKPFGEKQTFSGFAGHSGTGSYARPHLLFARESGDKLVFMGDVIHAPEIQFANRVSVTYDIDPI